MAIIQCAENSEFSFISELQCAQGSEFIFSSEVYCAENSEWEVVAEIQAPERAEFYVFQSSIYDTINYTVNEDTEYLQYVVPNSFYTLVLNTGEDYSKYCKDLRVTKTLGGKTYVEMTLIDLEDAAEYMENILRSQSRLNPFYDSYCSSVFAKKFTSSQTDPVNNPNYYANAIASYFKLTVSVGYDTFAEYTYAYLVPTEWNFDGSEFVLRCEDFTVLLEQEGQSMTPDINADVGVIGDAHGTIKAICDRYGVTKVVCNFPNYTIRLLRRTEDRPLNWLDMICKVYQVKRRWSGSTLILERTSAPNELSPKWNITEGLHIIDGTYSVNIDYSQYKNKFTISRTSPNGGAIGEQDCTGYDCPGRTGFIKFDIPVTSAGAVEEVTNGGIENYVYFTDEAGTTPLNDYISSGPDGKYIIATTPIKSVRFTYRANIGTTSQLDQGSNNTQIGGMNYGQQFTAYKYLPHYKVVFYGKNSSITGIDTDYKFTAASTYDINCVGLYQEYSNIEDPIIPNTSVAQAYAAALLKEATRKLFYASLETPFINPFIEPGDCVSITDYESNFTNVKWLCEESVISFNGEDVTQTLKLSKGLL